MDAVSVICLFKIMVRLKLFIKKNQSIFAVNLNTYTTGALKRVFNMIEKKLISKLFVLSFIIFIFSQGKASAGDEITWLSPGIKLGYHFGDGGGFIIGAEVSILWDRNDDSNFRVKGIAIDYNYCQSLKFSHLSFSFEGHPVIGNVPMGVSVGPGVIFKDEKIKYGVSAVAYTGVGLVPFVGSTYIYGENPDFETGSYIKIPIAVKGSFRFSIGG
jgi:hypothetical protein